MKTNVSIKFSSIEEYREIEKKLEELGYNNDYKWNNGFIMKSLMENRFPFYYIFIYKNNNFELHNHNEDDKINYHYNSLEEFLKDE